MRPYSRSPSPYYYVPYKVTFVCLRAYSCIFKPDKNYLVFELQITRNNVATGVINSF